LVEYLITDIQLDQIKCVVTRRIHLEL